MAITINTTPDDYEGATPPGGPAPGFYPAV